MSDWVPYHAPSVNKAKMITRTKVTELSKYQAITEYVSRCFVYDYIKAIKTAKLTGVLPDVNRTWETGMGICQDIAAMVTGMLRSVGIHAELCIGTAGSQKKHAWVEAEIDGKLYRYDHRRQAKQYITERRY